MRNRILKRLSYLFTGETTSLIMFVFISYLVNYTYSDLHLYSLFSFWSSFLLLEFLLLQGSIYWFVKWKRLKKENTSAAPIRLVEQLWAIKKWNIAMIIIIPAAFIADYIMWLPSTPQGLTIAAFIYIFAILEYVNYFHIQLSYDNRSDINSLKQSKRFKQASLSKDFKRLKKIKRRKQEFTVNIRNRHDRELVESAESVRFRRNNVYGSWPGVNGIIC